MKTIIAIFDERREAEEARDDLIRSGFSAADMALTGPVAGGTPEHREKGFWEKVKEFFGAEENDIYEEASRRGGTILSVGAADERSDQAADILNRHGAVDVDHRMEEWRRAGWKPAETRPAATAATAAKEGGERKIPVVQEVLQVGKRAIQKGGVRVFSHVREKPVEEDVHLREEKVRVERRPADRPAGDEAFRESTIEAREVSEEPVVVKEGRVVEEVIVTGDVGERTERVRETVRRTDVEVEPLEDDFRRDYQASYSTGGLPYEQYQPAYQYGRELAMDSRYEGRDWAAIESEARSDFEKRKIGPWDRFKDAVRHAFDRSRQKLTAHGR